MIGRLILGLFIACSSVLGQSSLTPDSLGVLSVATTPPGADIYLDSTYLGKSPLVSPPLAPGGYQLRIFYPSVMSWNPLRMHDSADIVGGSRIEKQFDLGTHLRIHSIPSGGTVTADRFPIGTTPFLLNSPTTGLGELRIFREGYDSVVLSPRQISEGFVQIRLHPTPGTEATPGPADLVTPTTGADGWTTYASAATMVVSGIASALLKDQANKEFDRYLVTKDAATLSKTRGLDKGAAITLAVSQISFVILAAILLSE